MPIYEYQCGTCDRNFEMLPRMQDNDQDVKCPACESNEVERQLSTFATGVCGTGSGRFT